MICCIQTPFHVIGDELVGFLAGGLALARAIGDTIVGAVGILPLPLSVLLALLFRRHSFAHTRRDRRACCHDPYTNLG